MKRKKSLVMLLAAAMVTGSLAGCKAKGQNEGTSPSAAKEAPTEQSTGKPADTPADPSAEALTDTPKEQTIVVSTSTRSGMQEGWEAVARAYSEIHPEITVKIDLKSDDGYDQWLQNVFANNETTNVDIVSINKDGGSATGKYIDWNDYMEMDSPYSEGVWKEQFDYASQSMADGGKLKSLCLDTTQVMWFYNTEIFQEVGVEIPTTWTELIDVCEKLSAAGYQPIAMDGDYDSFYGGTMGWLNWVYTDQTTRSTIELWRSQEGDYTYDPDIDGVWKFDPSDPHNDDNSRVTRNVVRFYKAVKDQTYTAETEGMKTVWSNLADVFPKYAGGDAMYGTNNDGATSLFYQGKAAMMVDGGWGIVEFINNMKAIASGETVQLGEKDNPETVDSASVFQLGTFAMPSMEGPGIEAPARTVEVAQGYLGAVSKDQEHNDAVADFMMYYSSSTGMGVFLDAALAAGYAPNGPSLVYGVTYPDDIAGAFANIKYIGNCQKHYGRALCRGLNDLPESTREFYNNAYAYLTGAITVDQYLEKQENNMLTYLEPALEAKGITMEDLENPAAKPAGLK